MIVMSTRDPAVEYMTLCSNIVIDAAACRTSRIRQHIAAEVQLREEIASLHQALPDSVDFRGVLRQAFCHAAHYGHIVVGELLLQHAFACDISLATALRDAARSGHAGFVQWLLQLTTPRRPTVGDVLNVAIPECVRHGRVAVLNRCCSHVLHQLRGGCQQQEAPNAGLDLSQDGGRQMAACIVQASVQGSVSILVALLHWAGRWGVAFTLQEWGCALKVAAASGTADALRVLMHAALHRASEIGTPQSYGDTVAFIVERVASELCKSANAHGMVLLQSLPGAPLYRLRQLIGSAPALAATRADMCRELAHVLWYGRGDCASGRLLCSPAVPACGCPLRRPGRRATILHRRQRQRHAGGLS